MSAENPEEQPPMPMYIFLASEITSEQLEMLGVYTQNHTIDELAAQIKVARDARVLLQSAPLPESAP